MPILNDAIIEKAWAAANNAGAEYVSQYAIQAALESIIPDVVEACAQQVIGTQNREDAVAFIRALARSE